MIFLNIFLNFTTKTYETDEMKEIKELWIRNIQNEGYFFKLTYKI